MDKRPLLVTIIAILSVLAGILIIIGGAVFLTRGSNSTMDIVRNGVIPICLGIFYLVSAYFLFTGNAIGWWIFVVLTVAVMIMTLIRANFSNVGGILSVVLTLVINVVLLWYFLRKQTQDFFNVSFPVKF